MKKILTLLIAFAILLFIACSSKDIENKKTKIVVSNWIGYSPLIYAYENGDLEKLNIELIVTTSLQSSLLMYEKNSYDGICSTKKELEYINKKEQKSLIPIPVFVFNRSFGGDMILSDIPKDALLSGKFKQIDVFLEKNSINELLFEKFKETNKIDTKYLINYTGQKDIGDFKLDSKNIPKLIVTYEPYGTKLRQNGFYLIKSTKSDELLVFDFLSMKNTSLSSSEIKQLQQILNNSIEKLKDEPRMFYNTIQAYFEDVSYENFILSLNGIEMFSKERKSKFLSLLKNEEFCKQTKYINEQ